MEKTSGEVKTDKPVENTLQKKSPVKKSKKLAHKKKNHKKIKKHKKSKKKHHKKILRFRILEEAAKKALAD